mmetsp:Transcript_4843/g.6878  ORF Transcript_4843/g.6878 Transcript_4843/m.6878 type:complete len:347 (+) Transcript_4843:318-1358(+)
MTVNKVRLVLSPNKKRNVKRPILFELRPDMGKIEIIDSLLKYATKKLCFKAKALYTREGEELSERNLIDYLKTKDGAVILVTKKKGEKVPRSPQSSPAIKAVAPPVLSRRASHVDHISDIIAPLIEDKLGSSITGMIASYASNCAAFDAASLPPTVECLPDTAFTIACRVAPARKKWKEKGSHKFTVLGYGFVQNTIQQVTFRVDCLSADKYEGDNGRMAIGIVDPRKFRKRTESSYGLGDCSGSWGLGCDGMFRHRGKVIKLQDGQGRTPSWKSGDVVGISINPMMGKLAFFVGRKQYRVNPRTVKLPKCIAFGVTFSSIGDQITFLDWAEQPTMQYCMPKELKL